MIYLKEFATQAEYDAFVASGQMKRPNVSYIEETLSVEYKKPIQYGVFIQHIDGTLFTIEQWKNQGYVNDLANGVAVITDLCSFVIGGDLNYWGSWGSAKYLDGILSTSDASVAKTDYLGRKNTEIMMANGNEKAAYACVNYQFPNGQTGYLPSVGEWYVIADNLTSINQALTAIARATIKNGSTDNYWTSTQSLTDAWQITPYSKSIGVFSKNGRLANALAVTELIM